MPYGLKALFNQFIKNVGSAPGWVPLLILIYLLLDISRWPSSEVLASAITFVAYQLGDALDEPIFKHPENGRIKTRKIFRRMYQKEIDGAIKNLKVDDGVYGVALKLAEAAKIADLVHLCNESCKFFRSLVVPLIGLVIVFWAESQVIIAMASLVLALISFYLYLWFKIAHLRRLYALFPKSVEGEEDKQRCKRAELDGMFLFFWDGNLIASGVQAKPNSQ